ncbi:recombinase family protein [Escherichia coli]
MREGDTLVVWALDRLGGSLGQVITLLDDLKKRGITFHSHQGQNRHKCASYRGNLYSSDGDIL